MEQADGDEGVELPADNDDNATDHGGFDEEVVDRLMQEIERQVDLRECRKETKRPSGSGKGATKSNSKLQVPTTPIEASTPVKRKANTTGTDA
jgi:hypothetical protein